MKKTTNMDLDNVEKMLIKKIESKKGKKNNLYNNLGLTAEKVLNMDNFSTEIVDYNKSFPEDNQINFHFDRKIVKEDLDKINTYNSNKSSHFKHSLKMYNQKMGDYIYTYFDPKKSNKTNTNTRNKSETSN